MKKKVLSIVLAMSVMAAAFTGCGAGAAEESSAASAEVSTEASSEVSTEASSEVSSEVSSEAGSEVSAEANAEAGDWAAAYDNYFDEHQIMRDNSQMTTELTQDGFTMGMVTAISGENFLMSFDFGTMAVDMYCVDNTLYSRTVMEGEEAWVYAPVASEEDTEGIKDMDASIDDDSIVSWSYREEVTENDILYDLLDVETQTDEGEIQNMVCYVNRESQEIDRYVIEQDGMEVEFLIEDIEGVELPAEAANATESTAEEITMGLVGVIMMAAMASAGTAQ